MIVISDTTTISNLIHINQLTLLHQLYLKVIIPLEVYNELIKLPHQKTLIDSLKWIEVAQIDEILGRKIAKEYGLRIIGLLGILVQSKQKKFLKEVKPLLDQLIYEFGFRVHPQLYRKILNEVDE